MNKIIKQYKDKFFEEIKKEKATIGSWYCDVVLNNILKEIVENVCKKEKELREQMIVDKNERYKKLLGEYIELQKENNILTGKGCPCGGDCCKEPNVVRDTDFISKCLNCGKTCRCEK